MKKKSECFPEQNGKPAFALLCFILRWGNKEVLDLAYYLLRLPEVYKLVIGELTNGGANTANKQALLGLIGYPINTETAEHSSKSLGL